MIGKNIPEKLTHLYVVVMLFVFPLFTGPEGYILLTEKKYIFFVLCTLLWSGTVVVWRFAIQRKNAFKSHLVPDMLVFSAVIAVFISTFSSKQVNIISVETGRCDGLLTYLLYGCIMLGVFHYGTACRGYLYILAGSYTLMCTISLLQLFGYNPFGLYPNNLCYQDPVIQEISPFLGTLGNIDVFSAMHCLVLPLLFSELIYGKNRNRWILILSVLTGILCVYGIRVASGILALFLTGLLFIAGVLLEYHPVGWTERTTRLFIVVFMTGSILGCLLCVYIGTWDSQTMRELQQILRGECMDTFGSNRIRIWKHTWKIVCKNPIFGIGADNLGTEIDLVFQRYSSVLEEWLVNGVDNAHNEYLHYLVSFGIVGTVPIAILLILTYSGLIKKYMNSETVRYLAPSFICYSIQAFFNVGLCIVTPVFLIAWSFLLKSLYFKNPDYD